MVLLQTSTGFQTWIQLGANVVLAVFTVVLAWATLRYTQQSKAQTEEMKKSRQAEFRPYLKAATSFGEGGWTHFLIENMGKGTAQNVEVQYHVEGVKDSETDWGAPLIHPDEDIWFGFPLNDNPVGMTPGIDGLEEVLADSEGVLVVEMRYEDALNNKWERIDRLDILGELRERSSGHEFHIDDLN